jgi:oligosaccharide repeat unit polymerase
VDRKRFGTWITPFNVLGFPYTIVVLLAYFVSESLGFVSIFLPSVFIWMGGLFLVWTSGQFLAWAVIDLRMGQRKIRESSLASVNEHSARRVAMRAALVAVAIVAFGTFLALKSVGGWAQVGTPDFKAAYSRGILGHAVIWSCLLGIVLIGTCHRKNRLLMALVAIILVVVVLGQVKGRVLHLVIGGLFFRFMGGKIRLSFAKVLTLLMSTCIIFSLGYIFAMLALDSGALLKGDTYSFLSTHYLYYLLSGPLSFGEALRGRIAEVGGDWHSIFAPFINLYRVTLKAGALIPIGSSHDKGMIIDDSGVGDNVYTFFGTLYLYLGAGGAAIYSIIIGLSCYAILVFAQLKRNAWLTALYCYIVANLAVGFFEFYFWHLDCYELSVATGLFAYVSRFIRANDQARCISAHVVSPI